MLVRACVRLCVFACTQQISVLKIQTFTIFKWHSLILHTVAHLRIAGTRTAAALNVPLTHFLSHTHTQLPISKWLEQEQQQQRAEEMAAAATLAAAEAEAAKIFSDTDEVRVACVCVCVC